MAHRTQTPASSETAPLDPYFIELSDEGGGLGGAEKDEHMKAMKDLFGDQYPAQAEALRAARIHEDALMAGRIILGETTELAVHYDPTDSQAELFRHIRPSEPIVVPNTFLGGKNVVLPSVAVESPKGKQALLVPLFSAPDHDRLAEFVEEFGKKRPKSIRGKDVTDMLYEAVVRMLDTDGASGLHHLHAYETVFPNPVYYSTNQERAVYVTRLPSKTETPLLAFITATDGHDTGLEFIKYLRGRAKIAERRSGV